MFLLLRRQFQSHVKSSAISHDGLKHLILAYRADRNGAVVEDFQFRPGFLYTSVRAISARINQNYDAWPSKELIKSYKTFLGKPCFVNHNNSDPSRARGRVVAARYIDAGADKYVEVIQEIDASRFPKLAKEIREGGLDSVSMGVEAGFTICSVCTNRATDVFDMCSHVKYHKGEHLPHTKTGKRTLCYEDCYKLGFFELSYVFDPADETAVVSRVIAASRRRADVDDFNRPIYGDDDDGQYNRGGGGGESGSGGGGSRNAPSNSKSTPNKSPSGQHEQTTVPQNGSGLAGAVALAEGANGNAYDYSGAGNGKYDCSGFQSDIYNALTGKPLGERQFSTTSDFKALGFQPGYDPNSSYNIGVNPAPGMSGHMAGELNGVHVESGGASSTTMYGGDAVGPQDPQFSQQYHLPNNMIVAPPAPAPAAVPPPSTSGPGVGRAARRRKVGYGPEDFDKPNDGRGVVFTQDQYDAEPSGTLGPYGHGVTSGGSGGGGSPSAAGSPSPPAGGSPPGGGGGHPDGGPPSKDLTEALQRAGIDPSMYPMITGFSATEGNNPSGAPTLGFKDSQAGTSLDEHAQALAKQFQDRASVSGAFPSSGSPQEQASWMATTVGQNSVPSDFAGERQPPRATYVNNIVNSMPAAPAASPSIPAPSTSGPKTAQKISSDESRMVAMINLYAYGEPEAPADIDTLRSEDDEDDEDFHHYVESPDELRDPDLDASKRLDRDQESGGGGEGNRRVEDIGPDAGGPPAVVNDDVIDDFLNWCDAQNTTPDDKSLQDYASMNGIDDTDFQDITEFLQNDGSPHDDSDGGQDLNPPNMPNIPGAPPAPHVGQRRKIMASNNFRYADDKPPWLQGDDDDSDDDSDQDTDDSDDDDDDDQDDDGGQDDSGSDDDSGGRDETGKSDDELIDEVESDLELARSIESRRRNAKLRSQTNKSRRGQKGYTMGKNNSLAERGRVASRGRRRHYADDNGYTDGPTWDENNQGEQEDVFLSDTPPEENVEAPNEPSPISNTENNLVARIQRKTQDLKRDAQRLQKLKIQQAARRQAGPPGAMGGGAATGIRDIMPHVSIGGGENTEGHDAPAPPVQPMSPGSVGEFHVDARRRHAEATEQAKEVPVEWSGTDDKELAGDFEKLQPDKTETQPKDASISAFRSFDKWLYDTTGRQAKNHNANFLRRQAVRWMKGSGCPVEILGPTLGIVLRNARKNETRGASMNRYADEELELAAPDARIDVEAPVRNTTDEKAQSSQFDLGDFGSNAGDNIADPDLDTDSQIWAPGEGVKSANRKADAVAAVRYAEVAVKAGLIPEAEKYNCMAQAQTMRHAVVTDRTRLIEAILHKNASRRTAGTSRGTRNGIPSGLMNGGSRTASTQRTAEHDPANDSQMFL